MDFWTVAKLLVAVAVALTIWAIGAGVVRSLGANVPRDADEDDRSVLRDVDHRYRCSICGTEVVMTVTASADIPEAPRHCLEEMALVVEAGEGER